MIACFDVHYEENTAYVAALVFANWTDEKPTNQYTVKVEPVAEYVPGEFYKRELPGLLACYNSITEDLDYLVVDSFVWLENKKKGLGAYLHQAINEKVPVIGVAKTNFVSASDTAEVLRGNSVKPLFVTTAGTSLNFAVQSIKKMHGEFRLPTLLKSVDSLCRNFWR